MAMKFEKRLIILCGDNGAKGSLTLERNAYGFFAALNIFNLPDLHNGEYAVGIKNKRHYFTRRVGSTGRINTRIQLDDTEFENMHCVIFDTVYERPLLYGSNDNVKLWQGNMMDGFRSKKAVSIALNGENKPFEYSARPKEIENYFLDILPPDSEYCDSAVAAVNYYPGEMSIEVEYSKRDEDMSQFQNPVDRAVKEATTPLSYGVEEANEIKSEEVLKGGDAMAVMPWELERRYINRYKTVKTMSAKKECEDVSGQKTGAKTDTKTDKVGAVKESSALNFDDNAVDEETFQEIAKAAMPAKPVLNAGPNKRTSPREASSFKSNASALNQKDEKNQISEKGAAALFNKGRNLSGFGSNAQINSADSIESDEAAAIPTPSSYRPERASGKNIGYVFYEQVKPQLDELFKSNPQFELLEKLLPDTKWVKVDYDSDGKYYVVGLIGANPDYLCYGVPSKFTPQPPDELDGYCQWMPADAQNPEGDGFWLMFQDAVSGESIAGQD